jgi:predicted transcriptional regulator
MIGLGIVSMKHRTATAIIAEILHLASFRMSKTKIMYAAFLSHHQIQFYLQMLVESRLTAKEESSNVYKTTERGMQFLKLYKQLEGFVPDLTAKPDSIPTTPSGSPG